MMLALLLAAAVAFTPPTRLADPVTDAEGVVLRYSCDGARPLLPGDTLTARLTVRRQSPLWRVLAWELEAGDDAADREAWRYYWPLVREDAQRRWVREKVVAAGVRDTMDVPVVGDGRFAEVAVRRRWNGYWSCTKGRGVP